MLKTNGRIAATALVCLGVGLMAAGPARADNPDLLRDAEARRAVAAQLAERDIREARDDAYRTARAHPEKALERIRGLLLLVDNNPDFTDEKRADLTALLKRDLSELQKIAYQIRNPEAPSSFHPADHDPRVDAQKKLIDDAVARITSSKDAMQESQDLRARKSEALRNLFAQVDESSIPATTDFSFPRNWRELSMLRSKNNTLTATEKALLKALDTRISPDFTDKNFGGVIDWFQKTTGQTILLDKPALDDLNVNSETTTVNLHLDKVTTRTALKKMLADLGLTYIIKDETIFVTTPTKAKEDMTVRTYYIGDLIPQYDLSLGSSLSQYQALATIAQLVQMIQNNVDKDSWEVNGKEGGGTIVFDQAHMTLIVKQSAEMHYKMMQGFNNP